MIENGEEPLNETSTSGAALWSVYAVAAFMISVGIGMLTDKPGFTILALGVFALFGVVVKATDKLIGG